jgi:hypothetical protein
MISQKRRPQIRIAGLTIDPAQALTADDLRAAGAKVVDEPTPSQIHKVVTAIKNSDELWERILSGERGDIDRERIASDLDKFIETTLGYRDVSFAPIILAARVEAHRELLGS